MSICGFSVKRHLVFCVTSLRRIYQRQTDIVIACLKLIRNTPQTIYLLMAYTKTMTNDSS
jgi:hypothetical protein